jgi:HAD superfamily hydrolase (TIGR01509 family)
MHDFNFKPKALLFDLNGTMINDMEYHTLAWYSIMTEDLGAALDYANVKKEMYGKNHEVLERVFGKDKFSPAEIERLSVDKEKRYQEGYLPHLALIAGLDNFLEQAKTAQIPMAIGSAAIPFNIDFVLDNLNIRHYFKAIVSADDVVLSKPHPETFLKAAELLNTVPTNCLVFEDVPKGAEAAANAGMKAVVLTTTHQQEEFDALQNVIHFADDFTDDFISSLVQ